MGAVSHREVGFVVTGDGLFAPEHHAGLNGFLGEVVCEHLIHADVAFQDRPALQGGAGEDVACLAGMNADTGSVFVEEAGDEIHLMLQWFHRLKAFAEFHLSAGAFGPPMQGIDAIAHEQGGKTFWEWAGSVAGEGRTGNGFEPGEGHGDADTAQERAARNPAGKGTSL